MIIGRKLDLRRRGTTIVTTSTGLPTEWIEEKFEITSSIIISRIITLNYTPILGSEVVKLNGLVLVNDITWDYTISNNIITLTDNLELIDDPNNPMTDYLVVKYEKLRTS
jgi:hypothetical protein